VSTVVGLFFISGLRRTLAVFLQGSLKSGYLDFSLLKSVIQPRPELIQMLKMQDQDRKMEDQRPKDGYFI